MSFPRYPSYKDSGVEWLGEVPGHWDVKPLRRLVEATNAGEVIDRTFWGGSSELLYTCALQPLDCDYEGFPEWKRTTTNDLLLTRNGTPYIHKPVENAIYTNVVQRVKLISGEDRNFIATALQNSAVNLRGYGVSIESLNYDMWKSLPVAIPPVAEQTAIAAFLDRETAKIDELVAEQRRLMELLKEKRQAVISHAVTQGLNPHAPMKPSGIEWLGDVPAHWEVLRLKYVSPQVTVGIVVEPSKYYAAEGIPALRSLNIAPGAVALENLVFISDEANQLHAKSKLSAGDLVAVRSGQPGTTAVIPLELDGCNCIDLIIIRKPTIGSEWFLCWYLASDVAVMQFSIGSGGAIQQHFNVGTAIDLVVPVPPAEEQHRIVAFINAETAKLDTLTAEAQRAIDLLQERRSALISAAVTGKIDVRGIQALPQ